MRQSTIDDRAYAVLQLENGLRCVCIQDTALTSCAACAMTATGYFDDPDDLPGLAHFLEHAVHLGSASFPGPEYKRFLAQHAGSSNASTGMTHTRFHFEADADALVGALERLAAFFKSPCLSHEACEGEVRIVDAEYQQKRNSDSRKLLQLRRSAARMPYAAFSTGNLTTLWTEPASRNRDAVAELQALWARRYTAASTTLAVASPTSTAHMEQAVRAAFGGIPATPRAAFHPTAQSAPASHEDLGTVSEQLDRDPERASGSRATSTLLSAQPACLGARKEVHADDVFPSSCRGLLFEVAPLRELMSLDLVWVLPFSHLQHWQSRPVAFMSHILGHEAQGSLAFLLKEAGLIQRLSTSVGDHCGRLPGFTLFHCELALTKAGIHQVEFVIGAVYACIKLMIDNINEALESLWHDWQRCQDVLFEYQEKSSARTFVQDLAHRLHHYPASSLLTCTSVPTSFSKPALQRVLASLVPSNMNAFFSCKQLFRGTTSAVEPWYGARYSQKPLPDAWLSAAQASLSGEVGLPGLTLPAPSWACPAKESLTLRSSSPPLPRSLAAHPNNGRSVHRAQSDTMPQQHANTHADAMSQHPSSGAPTPQDAAMPHLVSAGADGVRLWLRDTRFRAPRTRLSCHLITQEVHRSALACATARLLARLLNAATEAELYDARLMRCGASAEAAPDGLVIHVWGFSDVVARIIERILATYSRLAAVLDARPNLFPTCFSALVQDLSNQRRQNPVQHALRMCRLALEHPFWHPAEQLRSLIGADLKPGEGCMCVWPDTALGCAPGVDTQCERGGGGSVSAAAVCEMFDVIRKTAALEVLVSGDADVQDARAYAHVLHRVLASPGASTVLGTTHAIDAAAAPPFAARGGPAACGGADNHNKEASHSAEGAAVCAAADNGSTACAAGLAMPRDLCGEARARDAMPSTAGCDASSREVMPRDASSAASAGGAVDLPELGERWQRQTRSFRSFSPPDLAHLQACKASLWRLPDLERMLAKAGGGEVAVISSEPANLDCARVEWSGRSAGLQPDGRAARSPIERASGMPGVVHSSGNGMGKPVVHTAVCESHPVEAGTDSSCAVELPEPELAPTTISGNTGSQVRDALAVERIDTGVASGKDGKDSSRGSVLAAGASHGVKHVARQGLSQSQLIHRPQDASNEASCDQGMCKPESVTLGAVAGEKLGWMLGNDPHALQLPDCSSPFVFHAAFPNPAPDNTGNAVVIMWRAGPDDEATNAMLELFVQVSSKACFHQLRTVEGIGYTVRLARLRLPDALFVSVRAQSSTHNSTHLAQRAIAWMCSFEVLANSTPESFDMHKRALSQRLTAPPCNLSQQHSRIWTHVESGKYDFFHDMGVARRLMGISIEQLQTWHQRVLLSQCSCFVVHLNAPST